MAHKADKTAFANSGDKPKGYTHHVVNGGFAVAGFKAEDHATADAADRNERGKALGVTTPYKVESASEATLV